ncbi:metallophosphoesterase [Chryseomicrobium palamuruense]|uniref:Metallophosphoesterase n=1 Tax=Chryseomicrobium palamuruense TaxID=682973 RepID=A0ABV8UTT7_9BACL
MINWFVRSSLALSVYAMRMAIEENIKTHHITSFKGKGSLELLVISDIHRRSISDRLLSKLPNHVDAILLIGDITERGVPISRTATNFMKLQQVGPLFYVFGNNDREVGEENLVDLLKRYQVTILQNDSVQIPEKSLQIVGLDDGYNGKVDMQKAVSLLDHTSFTVFMTHSPAFIKKIPEEVSVDLAIAGHYHGGQIRFGKWGIQPLGSFEAKDNRYELISNGFGTTALPFRIGAESEIHLIQIDRKK